MSEQEIWRRAYVRGVTNGLALGVSLSCLVLLILRLAVEGSP